MASETIFRLSNLPYDILELIINLLSPKDVVRLSTVSKEWRNLCPSLPCLKLNLHDHEHKSHLEKLQSDHTELNEYVDTLLGPYKTSGLCIFNLISLEQDNFPNFTQLLVSEAMKFSPRVINIDMFISNFASIHKIFTCRSVEELYLRDTSNKRTNKLKDLVIPSRMGVTLFSLRKLHIEFVRFYDGIISGCPVMEELSLKSCLIITVGSITSGTKLKFLSLDDCTFKCVSRTSDHDMSPLLFNAPNLVTLKVASSRKRKTLMNTLKIVYSSNGHHSCSGIQHLELCGRELKVLLDEELPKLPGLHNLKTLSLNGWCMDCHVGPLVQFLEHAPYLEKLTLWVNECYCLQANRKNSKRLDRVASNHANLRRIEKAPCNMLKNVEIRLSVGYNKKAHRSVMSFLRYAKVLEHAEISIYNHVD